VNDKVGFSQIASYLNSLYTIVNGNVVANGELLNWLNWENQHAINEYAISAAIIINNNLSWVLWIIIGMIGICSITHVILFMYKKNQPNKSK
ncbi:MAG: hypothetical protein ACRAS9_02785, partial [Mycoplasma sp.]